MNKISTQSVIVENRFRRDLGDLEALKASMAANGLLQAIGIDQHRRLVFGGRRLEAARQLGWPTIEAKLVDCDALIAEHDENEMRKAFTVSERVAIAEAVAERLGKRQGERTDLGTSGNISLSDKGQTRDLAAAKAGLGSGKTLEAAQSVIARGVPELVQAMDEGKVTIHAAKVIALLPHEEQQGVDFADPVQAKQAKDRAYGRMLRKTQKQASQQDDGGPAATTTAAKAEPKPRPDEQRLYAPESSLSAFVLSHRAKVAISQISKNDPNALPSLESIRVALDRQISLVTPKATP